MKGRVKWWNKENGYGFIELTDTESIFAHVEKKDENTFNINENQEIEFILEEKEAGIFLKLLNT